LIKKHLEEYREREKCRKFKEWFGIDLEATNSGPSKKIASEDNPSQTNLRVRLGIIKNESRGKT
jgi:hypothetical protein